MVFMAELKTQKRSDFKKTAGDNRLFAGDNRLLSRYTRWNSEKETDNRLKGVSKAER